VTDLMTDDTKARPFGVCAPTDVDDEWEGGGLCAQTDPEAFFPEKGGSTREAKAICRGCEVRHECLWTALERRERFGIWGGLSERERRYLLRQLPAITSVTPDADALDARMWLSARISAAQLDDSVVQNWLATPGLLARLLGAAAADAAEDAAADVVGLDAVDEQTTPDVDEFDSDLDLTERLAS
jgi:WhiB family transcriptional regulator, redox-sensing transcriptional regulator